MTQFEFHPQIPDVILRGDKPGTQRETQTSPEVDEVKKPKKVPKTHHQAQSPSMLRRMITIRERLDLKQWELGEIFGITTQSVYMWEKRGYPRFQATVMELLDTAADVVGIKRAKEIFLNSHDAGDAALVTALVRAVQLRE